MLLSLMWKRLLIPGLLEMRHGNVDIDRKCLKKFQVRSKLRSQLYAKFEVIFNLPNCREIFSNFAPCERCEYSDKTQSAENNERCFHAYQESGIVLRRDLHIPQVYRKYQRGDSHAEHLPCQPHRSKAR